MHRNRTTMVRRMVRWCGPPMFVPVYAAQHGGHLGSYIMGSCQNKVSADQLHKMVLQAQM